MEVERQTVLLPHWMMLLRTQSAGHGAGPTIAHLRGESTIHRCSDQKGIIRFRRVSMLKPPHICPAPFGEELRFTLIDNYCVNKEVIYENSSEENITS